MCVSQYFHAITKLAITSGYIVALIFKFHTNQGTSTHLVKLHYYCDDVFMFSVDILDLLAFF